MAQPTQQDLCKLAEIFRTQGFPPDAFKLMTKVFGIGEVTPTTSSQKFTAIDNGRTITHESILDKIVTAVIINDFTKNTDYSVSGNSITFTEASGTTVSIGDQITLLFE